MAHHRDRRFLPARFILLVKLLWIVAASIAVGVVVAAVFAPAVTALRARGHSRNGAALIVWAAAFGAIALAVLVLAIAFVPYLVQILTNVDAGLTQLQTTLSSYSVPPVVGNIAHDLLGFVLSSTGIDFGGILASIGAAATIVILAIFLIFFLLRDGDDGWRWAFQALGDDDLEGITDAGRVALVRVGGYLRGTTVLSAIIALTDYIFMIVLGTPLALSLAMLVFLGGYIPYFGGLVTSAIILLATYAAQGPSAAIALLVLIAIRNLIVGYGIRPTLYGKTVKIHPAIVLLALPAGFELAGVIGLFAAVPVTAVFLAVARAVVDVLEPDKKPHLPALVPAWLDRMAQVSWRSIVLIAVGAMGVAIFVALPLVILPVVGGLILAATLQQLVDYFVRRGWSRGVASAVSVGGGDPGNWGDAGVIGACARRSGCGHRSGRQGRSGFCEQRGGRATRARDGRRRRRDRGNAREHRLVHRELRGNRPRRPSQRAAGLLLPEGRRDPRCTSDSSGQTRSCTKAAARWR